MNPTLCKLKSRLDGVSLLSANERLLQDAADEIERLEEDLEMMNKDYEKGWRDAFEAISDYVEKEVCVVTGSMIRRMKYEDWRITGDPSMTDTSSSNTHSHQDEELTEQSSAETEDHKQQQDQK